MSEKKSNYLLWDDYFMGICQLSAHRSKDPNTQVGSCIIDSNNRIVAIGYNGFARGCNDDKLPWCRNGEWIDTKYPYVVHAEANAILNSTCNLSGTTLYTTLFPCNECTKLIIQSGISYIVYSSDKYKDTDSYKASIKMLDMVGIKYKKYLSKIKIEIKYESDKKLNGSNTFSE